MLGCQHRPRLGPEGSVLAATVGQRPLQRSSWSSKGREQAPCAWCRPGPTRAHQRPSHCCPCTGAFTPPRPAQLVLSVVTGPEAAALVPRGWGWGWRPVLSSVAAEPPASGAEGAPARQQGRRGSLRPRGGARSWVPESSCWECCWGAGGWVRAATHRERAACRGPNTGAPASRCQRAGEVRRWVPGSECRPGPAGAQGPPLLSRWGGDRALGPLVARWPLQVLSLWGLLGPGRAPLGSEARAAGGGGCCVRDTSRRRVITEQTTCRPGRAWPPRVACPRGGRRLRPEGGVGPLSLWGHTVPPGPGPAVICPPHGWRSWRSRQEGGAPPSVCMHSFTVGALRGVRVRVCGGLSM